MATVPRKAALRATSVDILNAIRNSATANYRDYVPPATPDRDSIREIGAIIMDMPALQNEFLTALVNRIGRVIITNKMYSNPWAQLKKGMLEFGETIEDVFVNIAKPFEYDPSEAESKVFQRETPDVRAAFYVLNYQKFYKVTIMQAQLRQAFMAWDGVTDLIAKITDSMYSAANYDEFLTMKYLIARNILNGRMYPVQVPTVSAANMKSIVGQVKGTSNAFEFMSTKYNVAGVSTYSDKSRQYIILNSAFDATMDVEVLASAFNMDKAEFMGHRILVDSFGEFDDARLNELFGKNPEYTAITPAEKQALDAIPGVLVDEDWFMIFDNLIEFTEQYNGQGLYWNYWLHAWKIFAASPFANAAVFVPGAPAVMGVTVSPTEVTTAKGQSVLLTANVTTNFFQSKAVRWTINYAGDGTYITPLGQLVISPDYAGGSTIIATATSVADGTKTAKCTVTISDAA